MQLALCLIRAINMIDQNYPTIQWVLCASVLTLRWQRRKKASIAGMHRSLLIEEIKKIVVVFRRRPGRADIGLQVFLPL